MSANELLQLTSFLLVFVSLLFVFFLLTVPSENKVGNRLLAGYLLIEAMGVSSFFYHDFINVPPLVEMLRIEIGSFMAKPLLFGFVLSILYADFRLKKRHSLHLLPFVLSNLILLPRFYLGSYKDKIALFSNYSSTFEGLFTTLLAHGQTIFYLAAIFVVLYQYKRILLDNYSISDRFNYSWLFQMNLILVVLAIVATIKNLHKYGDYGGDLTLLRWLTVSVILGFTCWLVLKALHAPKIFRGIDSKLQLTFADKAEIEKEALEESQSIEIDVKIQDLKDYMLSAEPYLNSELTIQDLANQLEINVRELSFLINHHLYQNFYEFISYYRIEKAKAILQDPRQKDRTILEILYQIGFNSKSSFNKKFKEATNMTPTMYRRNFL